MESQQTQKIKTVTSIIVILLVIGVGYVLFTNYPFEINKLTTPDEENGGVPNIVIEKTPVANGELPAPSGLPKDIPIESSNILESITTKFPDQGMIQSSVSYLSSKTSIEKYSEYKAYLAKAGYEVKEGDSAYPVMALFGTKADANLSVVVSNSQGKTLVQLAYLFKSTQ